MMLAFCGGSVFISHHPHLWNWNKISTKWAKHLAQNYMLIKWHVILIIAQNFFWKVQSILLFLWPASSPQLPPTHVMLSWSEKLSVCGLVRLSNCEKDSEVVNSTIHFFKVKLVLLKLLIALERCKPNWLNKKKPLEIWGHW